MLPTVGSIFVASTRSRKNQQTWEEVLGVVAVIRTASLRWPSWIAKKLHTKMFCEGMVQMQSETNGMPGEWLKEITCTCILRLGKWKHIPLISLRKTIKEF